MELQSLRNYTRREASVADSKPLRILLVEDERKLNRAIERQLCRAGYVTGVAFDAAGAAKELFSKSYDLVILDLGLPDRSGIDLLHELRSKSYTVPVLILSALSSLHDRVLGLETGADDYLTKPFDSSELVARIQAILRRNGTLRVSILQADHLVMDVVKRTVYREDQRIELTQTEFALLEFFLRNKNSILTRRRIIEQVWGYRFDTGTNIVDVYISYLRNLIDKEFNPKLIETVRGEGFVLRDR